MRLFDIILEFNEADRYMIYDGYGNLLLGCRRQDLNAMIPLLKNLKAKKIILKNDLLKIQLYTN